MAPSTPFSHSMMSKLPFQDRELSVHPTGDPSVQPPFKLVSDESNMYARTDYRSDIINFACYDSMNPTNPYAVPSGCAFSGAPIHYARKRSDGSQRPKFTQ